MAGMTTPWRVYVCLAYPIVWHTAVCLPVLPLLLSCSLSTVDLSSSL